MHKKTLFRRKSEGKTSYRNRLRLLVSRKPRLVIRKSLNNVLFQITEYSDKGDKILISAHSNQLKKIGWNGHKGNMASAYLTGLICGLKAKSKNIKEAVLDLGLSPSIKGSVLYAGLKGAVDSGLLIPHSSEVFPKTEVLERKGNFKEIKEKILKQKW